MTQLSDKKKKAIKSLSRKKNRVEQNAFLVEGMRSVDAALAAAEKGRAELRLLITTADSHSDERYRRAMRLGAESVDVPARELNKLSDVESSQGILIVASIPGPDPEKLQHKNRVLVLDGVQDPGNVGTLVRTAAWFGIEGVVFGPGTADLYGPKAARATMGGIWDVEALQVEDLHTWCREWREAGKVIYAADLGGVSVSDWIPSFPSALVVGSEAHGISSSIIPHISERIHIHGGMDQGVTESLNASIAGAVVMASWVGATS